MFRRIAIIFFIFLFIQLSQAQPIRSRDGAEVKLALKKLSVLGSVLYVAAHPDDENTALLATMVQGRGFRTAYLSCTRGEGGQNLLGPEQSEILGLIRTQELLAARCIDGAEQYFTRAIDFGFSKTSEETLQFWGHKKTLSDIVWVIRRFMPDVIITRFTPILGGHGNHTASALLAEEAFRAAADSTRFPEQFRFVRPWQAKRLVWNLFRFSTSDTTIKKLPSVKIDVGTYSPLLGKSFSEIAGEGRSMHKSQGFGAAQNRGEFLNYFQLIAGDSAKTDLFDGINTGWSRITGGDSVGKTIDEVYKNFDDEHPERTIPILFKALHQLSLLPQDSWTTVKKKELTNVLLACAGIWIDATTPENSFVPGGEVKFTATVTNRSAYPFSLERIALPFGERDTVVHSKLEFNRTVRLDLSVRVPEQTASTQPYWLLEKPETGSYNISNQILIGQAENETPLSIIISLSSPGGTIAVRVPLRQRTVDPVEGESLLPIDIVPPLALNLHEPVKVFPDQSGKTITLTLKTAVQNAQGTVRLKLPESWRAFPARQIFDLKNKGDEQIIAFSVQPLNGAKSGTFKAEAEIGKIFISQGIQKVQYRHIPPQTMFPIAEGKLLRIDLKKRGKTVGYIMGAGDEIPAAVQQMGYSVTLLSDDELAEGILTQYDVIVAGVRAYNIRAKLRTHQNRLMEYVERGGTYIVQYMTPQRGEAENLGPYPFTISRDRVTEEDAKVTCLNPKHPILTTPNNITDDDFKKWIQERGLYFADRWDARYDSVLTCHDQNESDKSGGLLAAKYGKGYYVFCAYAFFRQLPAGVEGAYRLFANILSLQGSAQQSPLNKSPKVPHHK